MTALAGYWDFTGSAVSDRFCRRMLQAQSVYGQQDGCWTGGAVALGRRIYRRLPEDAHDRGPVVGAGGKLVLAGDVRLDNRTDLRRRLDLAPAESERISDAELLLRGYERFGEGVLDLLVGDFAFAVWHPLEQRLILVRDYIGNRPLFCHRGDGFFAFASMPKGLHTLPDVPYAVNEERIADFLGLFHSFGAPSFFQGIDRVEAGHVLTVTPQGSSARRYWQPDLSPLRLPTDEDYVEAMRERLDAAVAARLRGVGSTVGAHLSAGLDSSGVTATAARLLLPESRRVVAFTSVPRPGARLLAPRGTFSDEGPAAARTAALYPNVEHVRIETTGRSPLDALERNFFLYDRPRLNLCNGVWIDAIKDEAKARGLSVLLTAQVGNLGMSYSGDHLLPELLASGKLLRLVREATAMARRGTRIGTIAAAAVGPFLPRRLWSAIAATRRRGNLRFYSALAPRIAEDSNYLARAEARGMDLTYQPQQTAAAWRLRAFKHHDSGIENKATLGGWGLDVRDPMTDRALMEFCLRVPTEQFLKLGVGRSLARRALADRIPAEICAGTRRGFQASDWPEGLEAARGELREEIDRAASVQLASGTLDVARLKALAADWPDDWADPALLNTHRYALLRGVSAGHFVRRVTGSNS